VPEKPNPEIPESLKDDSSDLHKRVAVLKRFKILLTQQRDRFKNYLNLLEKQQNVIETGNAEDLLNYVEIEEKIVADIFSIQKVIDPLEEMYYSVIGSQNTHKTDNSEEVPTLKESLEKLKNETVVRSRKNRELLSKRMLEIRYEIKNLRNNPYSSSSRRSNYSDVSTASLIDIKG
jgi:DNA-binding transcriptional regulator GbsR (MarR family)